MTDELNIPELRKLHESATPGPWHRDPLYWTMRIVEESGAEVAGDLPDETQWPSRDDAGYICALHNAFPRLLAALEEARAERDAIKATLAKHAESERVWCELATERGEKLEALVEASEPFVYDQACDAVHHAYSDRHDQRDPCPVVGRLRTALAAAKAQP